MPISLIPKALYPLVPKAPGVPAVLRGGAQLLDTLTLGFLGAGDFINSIIGSEPVQWGVFDVDGNSIADYDSFASMSYRDDARISDYPVEQGSFAAYNKVDNPFSVRVTLSCGGDADRRNAFQNSLRRARRSLDLYTVLCEDGEFESCNLVSLDWERTDTRGAHRVVATCEFQEVRERGTTAFSRPESASGYGLINQGQQVIIGDPSIDATGLV